MTDTSIAAAQEAYAAARAAVRKAEDECDDAECRHFGLQAWREEAESTLGADLAEAPRLVAEADAVCGVAQEALKQAQRCAVLARIALFRAMLHEREAWPSGCGPAIGDDRMVVVEPQGNYGSYVVGRSALAAVHAVLVDACDEPEEPLADTMRWLIAQMRDHMCGDAPAPSSDDPALALAVWLQRAEFGDCTGVRSVKVVRLNTPVAA